MLNKKNLLIGIMFIAFAIFCIISLVSSRVEVHAKSSFICGTFVFTIVGIAFLKRIKR